MDLELQRKMSVVIIDLGSCHGEEFGALHPVQFPEMYSGRGLCTFGENP